MYSTWRKFNITQNNQPFDVVINVEDKTDHLKSNSYIVESLKFVAGQLSWVTPPHKFTYSTKTNYERGSYLCETKNQRFYESTSPRISKKPTIHEKYPPRI